MGSSYKYRCQLAERAKRLPQAGDEPAYRLLTKMLKDWINDDNSLAKVKASIYNDLLAAVLDDMNADFNALIDVFWAKQVA